MQVKLVDRLAVGGSSHLQFSTNSFVESQSSSARQSETKEAEPERKAVSFDTHSLSKTDLSTSITAEFFCTRFLRDIRRSRAADLLGTVLTNKFRI